MLGPLRVFRVRDVIAAALLLGAPAFGGAIDRASAQEWFGEPASATAPARVSRDATAGAKPQAPPPSRPAPESILESVCTQIEASATQHGLPPTFLARLIWTESRFDPNAVSPKGAQGIAQFMPGTARMRGLEDPFAPDQAIAASAAYLAELRRRFGNLGLAAAAYNSGEGRVSRWQRGETILPRETVNYVAGITGVEAETWASDGFKPPAQEAIGSRDFQRRCQARKIRRIGVDVSAGSGRSRPPWGVQLAGHFSRAQVVRMLSGLKRKYARLIGARGAHILRDRNRSLGRRVRHIAVIGEKTRAGAQALCARIRQKGGFCLVVKN